MTSDTWRSYFLEERENDVEHLVEAYPDQRSLHVDIIDLHDFDTEFVQTLFENPDPVLAEGRTVLRDLVGVSGLVHLRVENNPHQRSVSGIRAYHVDDIVTVQGVVESVDAPEATAVSAVYDCPVCDRSVSETPSGIALDPPTRCENCGWDGEFTFRPSESRFVDLQHVSLAASETANGSGTRTLPVYLDDDLVGDVAEGERSSITGVVRVRSTDGSNRFSLYLDAISVREERQADSPATPDDVLDSHWDLSREQ